MKPEYILISSDSEPEPEEPPQMQQYQQKPPLDVIDLTSDAEERDTPTFHFSLPLVVDVNSDIEADRACMSRSATVPGSEKQAICVSKSVYSEDCVKTATLNNSKTLMVDISVRQAAKKLVFDGILSEMEKCMDLSLSRQALCARLHSKIDDVSHVMQAAVHKFEMNKSCNEPKPDETVSVDQSPCSNLTSGKPDPPTTAESPHPVEKVLKVLDSQSADEAGPGVSDPDTTNPTEPHVTNSLDRSPTSDRADDQSLETPDETGPGESAPTAQERERGEPLWKVNGFKCLLL